MKTGIHPYFNAAQVICNTCGNKFETYSSTGDLKVEICSNCHPFFTGKVRDIARAGQVEKFRNRYKQN